MYIIILKEREELSPLTDIIPQVTLFVLSQLFVPLLLWVLSGRHSSQSFSKEIRYQSQRLLSPKPSLFPLDYIQKRSRERERTREDIASLMLFFRNSRFLYVMFPLVSLALPRVRNIGLLRSQGSFSIKTARQKDTPVGVGTWDSYSLSFFLAFASS